MVVVVGPLRATFDGPGAAQGTRRCNSPQGCRPAGDCCRGVAVGRRRASVMGCVNHLAPVLEGPVPSRYG